MTAAAAGSAHNASVVVRSSARHVAQVEVDRLTVKVAKARRHLADAEAALAEALARLSKES